MFELLFKTTTLLILEIGIPETNPIHGIMDGIANLYDNDQILEAEDMLRDVSKRIITIMEQVSKKCD